MFFCLELSFEAGEVARIFFFNRVSPLFEGGVPAIELKQPALAEPKRRCRDAL
jgi:hypothetical protein